LDEFVEKLDRLSPQDWALHRPPHAQLRESKTQTMLKLFKSGFYLGISQTLGNLNLPFSPFKRFSTRFSK
jgi:hypothetical protein